jgi:hypothetical protein
MTMATVPAVVQEPATTVSPTSVLIKQLDIAGCDFKGLALSEGTLRKGSSTLMIECK